MSIPKIEQKFPNICLNGDKLTKSWTQHIKNSKTNSKQLRYILFKPSKQTKPKNRKSLNSNNKMKLCIKQPQGLEAKSLKLNCKTINSKNSLRKPNNN